MIDYPKLILWGATALGILMGILGLGYWVYSAGYSSAETKWAAKYADLEQGMKDRLLEETQRQIAANTEAKKREAIKILQLQTEKSALEKLIGELDEAADKDPLGGRECLSDDSRLRINKVR